MAHVLRNDQVNKVTNAYVIKTQYRLERYRFNPRTYRGGGDATRP